MSLSVTLDVLQELETLAARVGKKLMELHDTGLQVQRKIDGSPVTEADRIAEDMIIQRLSELTPDIPIIAEERYSAAKDKNAIDVSHGQFWLVDALDGTREFASTGKDFTVNIGLITNNVPALGIINWPASEITYSGIVSEKSANKIYADGRREVLKTSNIGTMTAGSLRVVSSKSFGSSSQLARFLTGRSVLEHRYRASSIKFCEIAEGRADLYPRFGASCEWDTAAGHAIVLAAGGSVTTSAGQPLLYGKSNFLNSDFIASGAAAR